MAKQPGVREVPGDRPAPRSVVAAAVLAVIGGLFLIRPYVGTVLFAVLTAYIFNPALTMLAVFAGLVVFGTLGVVWPRSN